MTATSDSGTNRRRLRGEMGTTTRLAAPLIVGHVSTAMISFVDSVIAGHHHTATLASVSVATAMMWFAIMLPLGVLMSIPPMVSEMDGSGQRSRIGPLFRQALWLAIGIATVLFVYLTFAPALLGVVGMDPLIVPGARDFLHAVRWGMPGLCLFFCMRYLAEGLHWTRPTMYLSLLGLAVLAPVGYILTFGLLGLPSMGAKGLGYASALSMWIQALGFLLVLLRSQRLHELRLFKQWDWPQWPVIRRTLVVGLPIGVMVLMEGGLFTTTAVLMGRLGALQSSAHQIAISVATLCFMIPLGVAEATTVRVGHALGRNDYVAIRRAMYAGLAIVLMTQLVSASIMILGNHQLASLYSEDTAVLTLASSLLLFAATFQFPDGVQVISAATLRGLQDTTVPMWMAVFSYWMIGMPVGILLGFYYGMGPKGMWIGLICGLTLAAILLNTRARATIRRHLSTAS